MGSRRKRKSDRLTAGAAGVARQARDLKEAPLASARNISPGTSPSSASRRAVATSSTSVRAAKPHTDLSTSGDADQGGAARSDSQRQARVGLVTKQTDDGSYELVYEALDAEDHAEPDEAHPTPQPWWRQRSVQLGLFALIGLLFIGGTLAFALSGGDEQSKPRKVAANNQSPPGGDAPDKEKPRYQYVAPTNPEGQLNDDEGLDNEDSPTTTTTAAKRPSPPSSPPKDTGDALNANPPTPPPILDTGKLNRVPSLDLRPNIPSGSAGGIRPDLNPRTRDLLGKRLNNVPLDPTGAPIDDDEGDDEGDDDEGDDDEGDDDEGDDDEGDDDEGDDDEGDDDEGDDDEGDDDEGDDDDEFID